jgi:hypothetical protein
MLVIEDLLHRTPEEARESQRKRQGRRVPLLLDRVDRLARDVDGLGQLLLRESSLGPERPDVVSHRDVKLA